MNVDPPRRIGPIRRPRKAKSDHESGEAQATEGANLPTPVGEAQTVHGPEPVDPTAAVTAQILGQTGARRGLRAGPTVIDTAHRAYNQAEWSGAKDRRTPKGRVTKTEI